MALTPGTRLGVYEVVTLLGVGGMGEVYRAKDTRLKRDVALKVLPDTFAQDADRLARFQREAELLATLNHPNIAGIYGLEESNGMQALVLELVEGPTLADRITGAPIPIDEALAIARQIADALEAAHEQGVIHRDLKPANIKVTPDGNVKVLDFGLAKMLETAPGASSLTVSPTLSLHATYAGVILGTAAYMSPEQAKGRSVDRRADIWAFGSVLYELLTGKQAFQGENVTEILAAVVMKEPALDALPAETPPTIRNLLRRCLEKDVKRRLQHVGEARISIEDGLSGSAPVEPALARRKGPLGNIRVAYASDESGSFQVFVQSFPKPDLKRQVSTAGGMQPRWRRDSKELFYVAADRKLMSVPLKTDQGFEVGLATALFDTPLNGTTYQAVVYHQYDVASDGKRFLLRIPGKEATPALITVVVNWTTGPRNR